MAGRNRSITGVSNIRITINGQEINVNGGDSSNTNQRDNDNGPKKCPQCGDTLEGENKICESCDYISDADSLNDSLTELEELMNKLRFFKAGSGVDHQQLLTSIDYQIIKIRSAYGASSEVREKLDRYETEKNAVVKKRNTKSNYFAFGCAGVIVIIAGIIIFSKYYSDFNPTPEKTIEKLITEKKISKARAVLPQVTDELDKADYKLAVDKLEIDSLTSAKNYDEAVRLAGLLPNITDQLEKIEEIVPIQVNELIKNKEFDLARKKTYVLANIYLSKKLNDAISLAEKNSK